MRLTLGTPSLVLATLLTLGLSACGQDAGDTATEPSGGGSNPSTSQPTSQPTDQPTEVESDGPVPFTRLALLTSTEEAGAVSTTPVALDSEGAVADFTSQFTGARLAEDIRATVSGAPDIGPDQMLVGAVLTIGCDRPTGVTVERVGGVVQVSAVMPKRQVQCFAPQTSVAILVVDTVTLVPIVS